MKTFFVLKDNIIDKRIHKLMKEQAFIGQRKQIFTKIQEIVGFYSENFTKNNKKEGERQLLENETDQHEMRRKDAILIAFFCGTITIIIFMIVTLLSIPDSALEKQLRSSEA